MNVTVRQERFGDQYKLVVEDEAGRRLAGLWVSEPRSERALTELRDLIQQVLTLVRAGQ